MLSREFDFFVHEENEIYSEICKKETFAPNKRETILFFNGRRAQSSLLAMGVKIQTK